MSHYNDFQFHIALHETATKTEIKLNMHASLARSAVFFFFVCIYAKLYNATNLCKRHINSFQKIWQDVT